MLFITLCCLFLAKQSGCVSYHQELTARKLFTYRSYRDVQLFQFEAPVEIINATFSLTAEETNRKCYPRQVTIYIQHGSYPVFPVDGQRFPDRFHVKRTSLSHRTIMSDGLTIEHVVAAPLPGHWFVAAFLTEPHGNTLLHKGLGPFCSTTLRAVASFERQQNVVSLIPEVTNHQQLILTQKINSSQFYKVLVPPDVDHVTVNVSKCDRKDGGGTFFRCPLVLSARPLALPEYSAIYTDTVNCSQLVSGACVLRVTSSPGEWHYVRLDVLPRASVQFGIQIMLDRGCVGREPRPNNDYLLVSEMRCDNSARTAFIPVAFGGSHTPPPPPQMSPGLYGPRTSSAICSKKLEMARISMPGSMSFIYEQLPSATDPPFYHGTGGGGGGAGVTDGEEVAWSRVSLFNSDRWRHLGPEWRRRGPPRLLSVSTSRATMLAFSVRPGHDIGGTLTVALTLPADTDVSVVNVSVVGCLSLWRHTLPAPSGACPGGVRLEVNSTSVQHGNVTSVPYPEPGQWYLTLLARCYMHDQYSRSNSYIPCPREHIPVALLVESTPCLQTGCSGNGECVQYYSGGHVFSTCLCWAGYSGWACSDAGGAISEFELLLGTLLLTLSNLLFAPSVALAVRRGHYTQALVYLMAMLCSTFYHACDAEKYSFCLLRLSVLQFGDFFCGILAFWVTLAAMSGASATVTAPLNILAAIVVALCVEYDRTGVWVFAAPILVGLVLMITSWVLQCRRRGAMYPSLRYLSLGVVPGAAAACLGLVCYTLLETRHNYRYTHSAWHCCVALAVLVLLPYRSGAAAAAANSSGHKDDTQRLYCMSARAMAGVGDGTGAGGAAIDLGSTGDSTSSRGRLLVASEAASGGGTLATSGGSTPRHHKSSSQSRLQQYQ